MSLTEKIKKMVIGLYPKGRAFRFWNGSTNERVQKVFANEKANALKTANKILDQILPDNDNFTANDASKWEVRLGLPVNENVPLSDRIDAIKRKYKHPGNIQARQSVDYIQDQLRDAGFDVYVFENVFFFSPLITTPQRSNPTYWYGTEASGISEHATTCEHAEDLEHGVVYSGSIWPDMVANHIDEDLDNFFNIGTSLGSIFYVGGQNMGDYANVSLERKIEFRQLIMKLKPANTVAVLAINYI